jgi:16S rRNA (cytidine1402-2'-O)-methyltransferase
MASGTLFVVATPIGNLEDITLRALRVLREADLIAAEDTRRTAKLLAHHAISTRSISFHAHNTRARIPQLLARLRGGARVAVVSDAGTPGISDPGLELVQACIDEGISVDPVPGVSAPLTAAVASGFPLIPLTVFGFVPTRAKDRTAWLALVSGVQHTVTFFETPHRIAVTLAEAARMFGNRPILIARELTKKHQEFIRGSAATVSAKFFEPRGEFTVVLGPLPAIQEDFPQLTDQEIAHEFGLMANIAGPTRRATVAAVAKRLGRSSRQIYAAIERAKNSG